MRDYITLGPVPVNEDCAQVGSNDYCKRAQSECKRYKDLILKKHGQPPSGAFVSIHSFPHDFGSYFEVVVGYDDNVEDAVEYAFKVEADLPMNWED